MTTLNLAGYPTDKDRLNWDREVPLQVPHDLGRWLARTGQWKDTPPGRVVMEQLWPALGGGQTNYHWQPPSTTAAVDLSGLNRTQLSSLARMLDDFARTHPNTGPIAEFVRTIIAEDAAAQTDPHGPRLFDM